MKLFVPILTIIVLLNCESGDCTKLGCLYDGVFQYNLPHCHKIRKATFKAVKKFVSMHDNNKCLEYLPNIQKERQNINSDQYM